MPKDQWAGGSMRDHVQLDCGTGQTVTARLVESNPAISEASDSVGRVTIVSQFNDDIWDLWPHIRGGHISSSSKRIDWLRVPEPFRLACKVLMYVYWKNGRRSVQPPSAQSIVDFTKTASLFFTYLVTLNVRSVAAIAPIHISNYVHHCKADRKLGASATIHRLRIIDLLYCFRDQVDEALPFDPWRGASIEIVSGGVEEKKIKRGVSQTDLIPLDHAKLIFEYAEGLIAKAQASRHGSSPHEASHRDQDVLLRTACFFVLGLLTGMRYSELISLEEGCTRTETRDGVTFNYIKAFESKTKKGMGEYLTADLGIQVIRLLERISEPYRKAKQADYKSAASDPSQDDIERLRRQSEARTDGDRLFLYATKATRGGGIAVPTNEMMNLNMKSLAEAAGSDWNLTNHQMRRTFAWTFARHKLGNLLFLKEQMKHSSLSMTQMYAASPSIDVGVLSDVDRELVLAKSELVQGWLDGVKLAGGAGRRIETLRNNSFENRQQLIEDTAEKVSIRSTGHAWCLSQDEGCGGAGLYERTRCVECKSGVIDDGFGPVWTEAYLHLSELDGAAQDLGPAAIQRVGRDLSRAKAVLEKLGLPVPSKRGEL